MLFRSPAVYKAAFGIVPPDLSLVGRSRGSDWLYTYMRSFYRDETRPTGWNNTVFPNVGMPQVLWQLQGEQRVLMSEEKDPHDHEKTVHVVKGFELNKTGSLNKVDYDEAVADLVAYLQWIGEPAQNQRVRLGVWVLLFLLVFTLIAWRMNAVYWKDIK